MADEKKKAKRKIKQKSDLSEKNWIVKSNTLNEVRNNRMTIGQQRFFIIYQSRINPNDPSSRVVTFRLDDYAKIMDFKKFNLQRIRQLADDLLGLTVSLREENGGMTVIQIFKRFSLFKGENDEWLVTIDCHDEILPYLFELKSYFFKYQLWNTLRLKSSNQIRMYEILKQYEYIGERIVGVEELRELLGILPDEYPRYNDFKTYVLESCKKALKETTDIEFQYEPHGKRGERGKILTLKFTIEKNENYIDQLTLTNFLDLNEVLDKITVPSSDEMSEITLETNTLGEYSHICANEFDENEIEMLYDILATESSFDERKRKGHLKSAYDIMKDRAKTETIKNRFAYVKGILENKISENNTPSIITHENKNEMNNIITGKYKD